MCSDDLDWIKNYIKEQWGDEFVVAHEEVYYPHKLPGFLAVEQTGKRIGLLTYMIQNSECEIVTLNSIPKGIGVGRDLMNAVKEVAIANKCKRIWLITTNDNLNAIGFYQKLGYELVKVHRRALEKSRQIKPSIPLISSDGIPIRDEIELELTLSNWS